MAQREGQMKTFLEFFTGKEWERETFPLDRTERGERRIRKEKDPSYPADFRVDGYNEELQVVWEYDGPRHYNEQKTIEKDNKRRKFFKEDKNIKHLIEFPFFCTFTEEVVRHYFFQPLFDGDEKRFKEAMENKYDHAKRQAYHGHKEDFKTPGWHKSPYHFFLFKDDGKKRFLKELEAFPKKTHNEIVSSMYESFPKRHKESIDKRFSLKE